MAITVAAGQPIRATHVNQFTRWLTAAVKEETSLGSTHASSYALTVTAEHAGATGNILKLGYGTGTAVAATFTATGGTITGGLAVTRNAASEVALYVRQVHTGGDLFKMFSPIDDIDNPNHLPPFEMIHHATAGTNTLVVNGARDLGVTTNHRLRGVFTGLEGTTVGTAGDSNLVALESICYAINTGTGAASCDSSAISAIAQKTNPGASAFRALEGRARRYASASGTPTTNGTWGVELAVLTTMTSGGNPHYNVGAMILSGEGHSDGYGTETRADSGVYIGGPAGWYDLIYGVNTAGAVLFRVSGESGEVTTRDVTPLTASTYQLGTALKPYLLNTANFFVVGTASTLSAPSVVLAGGGTSGVFFSNVTTVGLGSNGTNAVMVSASGVQVVSGGITSPPLVTGTTTNRNRLINGDFQVWQDGVSPSPNDNQYGPDQWRLLAETNTSATISRGSSAVMTGAGHFNAVLTVGAGNNNKFGIFQPLEGSEIWDLRGTVASLQAKLMVSNTRIGTVKMALLSWASTEDGVSGDPISAWGGDGTNPTLTTWTYVNTPADATSGSITPTTTAVLYKVQNLSVSATATNLGVFIWCDDKTQTAADTFTVSDVQLEPGPLCTNFSRRQKGLEEQLCQRYYNRFGGTLNVPFGAGVAVSSTIFDAMVILPAPMRTSPTITTVSTFTQISVYHGVGTPALATEPTILSVGAFDRAFVRATVSTGLTIGFAGQLYAISTAQMAFSARL